MFSERTSDAFAKLSAMGYGDDDDDDTMDISDSYTSSYVSKRASGAYSPLKSAAKAPMETPASKRVQTQPVSSVKKTPFSFQATQMSTPATVPPVAASAQKPFAAATAESKYSVPSFVRQASLDGDYRPYHDALLSLLQSKSKPLSIHSQDPSLQYIYRLMTSVYSRSSQLKDSSIDPSISQNIQIKTNLEAAQKNLEQEGHLWALIGQLASESEYMLLHNPQPASVIQQEIQSFIQNILVDNQYLDPAAIKDLIGSAFSEKESDVPTPPLVVKRRQIILDWIQSCHNRSLTRDDLSFLDDKENGKKGIMWKDTLEALKREQHSFMSGNESSSKMKEIHPDAPFLMAQSGVIQPFHGKDGDSEVEFLQKCLLLMKAGRMEEMWDLCHVFGQPWRVAAWNGNSPHGYVSINNTDSEMAVDGEESKVCVGNPKRALWKRNMWEISRSLHKTLQQNGEGDVSLGSIVYEAAISAILADDSHTASKNPLLNNNWMDSVYVFYHGLQARFHELIYAAHNENRRKAAASNKSAIQAFGVSSISTKNTKYPMEGTQYKMEEDQQLHCTSEMSNVEETAFIRRLQANGNSGPVSLWEKVTYAFLSSSADSHKMLSSTVDRLLQSNVDKSIDDFESLLKFTLHLILFIESFAEDRDPVVSSFYSDTIAAKRNDIITTYLEVLMEQKPLWEFTPLYASLLPEDILTESCTEFWKSCVFEEKNRRTLVKQAGEYFGEGVTIMILRNVVKQSFDNMDGFHDLEVPGWLGDPAENDVYFDEELESSITHDDVRKMHSLRWLTFSPSHYADAIVCSNMLMRSFLLQLPKALNFDAEDTLDDWNDHPKIYTAKVIESRFLPDDLLSVAEANDEEFELSLEKHFVDDSISEHNALVQFLDGHTMYSNWKQVVQTSPDSIAVQIDERFEEDSSEWKVALNLEKISYIKNKRSVANAVINAAEQASEAIMNVLDFDNGWLQPFVSNDQTLVEKDSEASQRLEEMANLRSKLLPATVFLLFRVLDSTATWMESFIIDIHKTFLDDADGVIARITSKDSYEADGMENPFLPEYWYKRALLLANTVAARETKIASSFSQEDLSYFMNMMAETSISLMALQDMKKST